MSMSQNTSHCKWELQHPSQQFRAIWETRKSRLPVVHLIMNDTEKGFWILYGLSSPCVIQAPALRMFIMMRLFIGSVLFQLLLQSTQPSFSFQQLRARGTLGKVITLLWITTSLKCF